MNINQIIVPAAIQIEGLEKFKTIVVAIKAKANTSGLSVTEHLFYNLLRGSLLNKGFKNPKIEITQGYLSAISSLSYNFKYKASTGFIAYLSEETITYYLEQLKIEKSILCPNNL